MANVFTEALIYLIRVLKLDAIFELLDYALVVASVLFFVALFFIVQYYLIKGYIWVIKLGFGYFPVMKDFIYHHLLAVNERDPSPGEDSYKQWMKDQYRSGLFPFDTNESQIPGKEKEKSETTAESKEEKSKE